MLRAVYKAIQCRTLVCPVPTSYKSCKVGATPAIKVLQSQQFLSKTIFHTNEAKVALIHRCRGPIPSTLIHRYCTDNMADNRYAADYAKLGTSGCKKCKQKLPKGSLRIAKLVANPFSEEGGDMKQYHHAKCMFETFMRARATTKIIEEPSDLEGYADLEQEDKDMIKELIKDTLAKKGSPKKKTVQSKLPVTPSKKTLATSTESPKAAASPKLAAPPSPGPSGGDSSSDLAARDNSFRQFRRLCADVAEESSNNGKTALVARYVAKGNSGDGFHGDTYLLFKLLLPGVVKTVYNLNDKQLAKIFSQIFGASHSAMVEDLENGDVAETVKKFFEPSKLLTPLKKSNLTLQQVDYYLTELAKYTKEDDQQTVLSSIAKKCTSNDLKMVIRLIKHDLRINAGARIILDGLDPNAYPAFQASRDLRDVVDRVLANKQEASGKPGLSKKLSVRANLMTPVLPMLAEACKSVEYAMKKCPNGMYAEIKYDGERVQVHKKGDHFEYYSRSLKPVLPHKVQHFKDHIPKAFPHGNDLILDSEVLLIDTKTSTPLPFGTLGVHKKQAFKDANVCLFIFDCLHYNGQNLMDKPIKERRKFLRENMTEVPNRILFSEMKHIREPGDLSELMMKVFREGLEGLVLKDVNSVYEPGKRHWLKVKKDYLAEGAMADTADLVVLGAYFGTGNKGGMKSIFLMGCYNADKDHWVTVSKCGSGFDDATLEKLQSSIEMVKISKDYTRIPKWLHMNKSLVPDFVVKDPKKSVVWEITGAEFSKSESHTADGISIRFPRCTKMRDDKSWEEATDLARLKVLYKKSKEHSDLPDVLGGASKGGPFKKKSKPKEEAMEVDDDSSNGKDMNGAVASPAKTSKSPAKRPAKDTPTKVTPTKKPKVTEASSTQAASPSKKLPDVFKGMKIYVPESVENYKQLKRFIIAFDGDMVPEFEKSSATHIILENGEGTSSSSQETVTTEWLWKCIKKKKLVPFKKGQ